MNIDLLLSVLRESRNARTVLCEGGPRLYGSLLRAAGVDDEFLTLCPKVLGDSPDRRNRRPSLVEDVAFTLHDTPRSHLIGLRRAGDYLFLRSRYS